LLEEKMLLMLRVMFLVIKIKILSESQSEQFCTDLHIQSGTKVSNIGCNFLI
jgi:hypothetical protein